MKKSILSISLLLSVILLFLASCQKYTVKGDGNIVSRIIPVSDYQKILLGGQGVKVNYTQSDEGPYLKIEGDRNILDLLCIESNNQSLMIRPNNKHMLISPSRLTITTRSSELKRIEMTGAIKFEAFDSLVCSQLTIDIAGKNTIRIDSLAVTHILDCRSVGDGKLELKGRAEETNFRSAGKNTFGTLDFRTNRFHSETLGNTDLEMTVLKDISTHNVGKIYVAYKTGPEKISQHFNWIGGGSYNLIK